MNPRKGVHHESLCSTARACSLLRDLLLPPAQVSTESCPINMIGRRFEVFLSPDSEPLLVGRIPST